MTKTYNIDAYGIPARAVLNVSEMAMPLTYTRHAMSEALRDRYGVLPAASFPRSFKMADGWQLVECETGAAGIPSKIVVRKPVDARRSLVLVILRDGTVKTLWTNLNTDTHATLDKSKFSQP